MRLLSIIKPNLTDIQQNIISELSLVVKINKIIYKTLTRDEAEAVYKEHKNEWYFERNIDHVVSGNVFILEIEADCICGVNAIKKKIRKKYTDPDNLAANSLHISDSEEAGKRELLIFSLGDVE